MDLQELETRYANGEFYESSLRDLYKLWQGDSVVKRRQPKEPDDKSIGLFLSFVRNRLMRP